MGLFKSNNLKTNIEQPCPRDQRLERPRFSWPEAEDLRSSAVRMSKLKRSMESKVLRNDWCNMQGTFGEHFTDPQGIWNSGRIRASNPVSAFMRYHDAGGRRPTWSNFETKSIMCWREGFINANQCRSNKDARLEDDYVLQDRAVDCSHIATANIGFWSGNLWEPDFFKTPAVEKNHISTKSPVN